MKKNLFSRLKQFFCYSLILALICTGISLSDTTSVKAADIPYITGYSASTDHSGEVIDGYDDHWINFTVNFSDKISITSSTAVIDNLNITLNSTSISSTLDPNKTYPPYAVVALGADHKSLEFKIHFNFAAMAGKLTITARDSITSIFSSSTNEAVSWPSISLLVSNGVQLQTINQIAADSDKGINASVTKKVIAPASSTRGMVHMIFLKNGQPVGTLNSYGANFTAHYHDYLNLNANSFTAAIADSYFNTSNSAFSADYNAVYNGYTITFTSKNSQKGDVLDMRVYTYPHQIQTNLNKSTLSNAISYAQNLNTALYAQNSINALNNEIAIAQSMNNSSYYLQAELDSEAQKLKSMADSMEFKPVALADSKTGISIESDISILPEDTILAVNPVNDSTILNNVQKAIKALDNSLDKFSLFNFTLTSKGTEIDPNGNVKVKIPVPNGYDTTKLSIYHIADDNAITKLDSTIEDGYIVFMTDSFSMYAVAQSESNAVTPVTQSGNTDQAPVTPAKTGDVNMASFYVLMGFAALLCSGAVLRRRKSNI